MPTGRVWMAFALLAVATSCSAQNHRPVSGYLGHRRIQETGGSHRQNVSGNRQAFQFAMLRGFLQHLSSSPCALSGMARSIAKDGSLSRPMWVGI